MEINARDDDWFLYTQTTTLGSLPGLPPTVGTRTLATGINQLSGLCLPPAAVRSLNPNQRIDRDEFTGATIDVTHVGMLANGRMAVTLRMSAGEAAWSEVTYDALSGLALELKTFDGPSPLYFTQTELQLTEVPAMPPVVPRLGISWTPDRRTVLISCPTEAGRFVTFFTSKDGCRTWQGVPGYQDRPGTGEPLVYTADIGPGSVFYRVQVR
ncbi:MAG: hypothetical protein AB9869_32335 [Verrucomicrobiia bacterium]